jgi:competence protein ComFC
MLCENLSLTHICKSCQERFLQPKIYKRKILNTEVISFYKYDEIKDLLHTKHTDLGYYIYNILAQNSFEKFAQMFSYPEILYSVAVDDSIKSGYSHTAILNKNLQSSSIKPLHNKLRAQNSINYSGKSREYRLNNPRNFALDSFDAQKLIVVDDIITTGSTLSQAINTIKSHKKDVVLCLTLADSSQK